MSSSSPVRRACRNCSVAKAKCTWVNTFKCERCDRLKKDCSFQVLNRQAKNSRAAQVAQIEKKLDGLISIIGTSHQLPLNVAESASASGILPLNASYNASAPTVGPSESSTKSISTRSDCQCACPSETAVLVSSSIVDQVLKNGQANKLVEFYRNALAFYSPFIFISEEKTAEDLCYDCPFLLRAILFSASYDNPSQQHYLEKDIMKYISDHLILKGERSIDLLQGLLVYITWYHYHRSGPFQTALLMQLAMAVLNDLGLNRASLARESQDALLFEIKHPEQCAPQPAPLSYTSCRIILGCFYLSSSLTVSSSKLDPMRYTSHIDDCVQKLTTSNECNTDSALVQMVKLQKIMQDAHSSSSESILSQKGQARMYVKMFQKALREYESALPMTLRQDKSLLLHYHTAEIQLYQVGLHMAFSVEEPMNFERMNILSACLSATKSFCHIWLLLTPSMYHTLTLVHFGQLTRALLVMVKLCVFEAEDWDVSQARQTVNMPAVIDEMIYRMESAIVALGGKEMSPCHLMRSVKSLKLGKVWYDAEVRKRSAAVDLAMHVHGGSLDTILLWDQFDGGVPHVGEE